MPTYVVTKTLGERTGGQAATAERIEGALADWGVKVLHKLRMHEKLVFIDDDILWSGSLNSLSFTDTQEVMERRVEPRGRRGLRAHPSARGVAGRLRGARESLSGLRRRACGGRGSGWRPVLLAMRHSGLLLARHRPAGPARRVAALRYLRRSTRVPSDAVGTSLAMHGQQPPSAAGDQLALRLPRMRKLIPRREARSR